MECCYLIWELLVGVGARAAWCIKAGPEQDSSVCECRVFCDVLLTLDDAKLRVSKLQIQCELIV